MSAESALIDSAGGDFEKVVIAVMLLSMLALLWYLVYQIPKTWEESQKSISKEWEKSTDRIVSKICEVVTKQDKILTKQEDLEKAYETHDRRAEKIWDNLDNRPCINGKHKE